MFCKDLVILKTIKHSFKDTNKNIKRLLAGNMERITERVENYLDHDQVENFHEFMHAYTDIFPNKFATKDYTYHNLIDMIGDKDLVLSNGDKDSSVNVMNRFDMQKMIDDGIINKIFEEITDHSLKDFENFQQLLYRNFKHENYDDMGPVRNQLAVLYGTAQTHKFEKLKDITPKTLQCCPIIDQTRTFTYKAAKVISHYLKPLSKKEYSISDTLCFQICHHY